MATFAQVFIQAVEAAYTGSIPFSFGQANAPNSKPYMVVLIVPPASETPSLMCEDQGDGGELLLQWSLADDNFPKAYNEAEAVKSVVQGIIGEIGTSPDNYYVIANRTGGVVSFDAALGTWSAMFESTLTWSKV